MHLIISSKREKEILFSGQDIGRIKVPSQDRFNDVCSYSTKMILGEILFIQVFTYV